MLPLQMAKTSVVLGISLIDDFSQEISRVCLPREIASTIHKMLNKPANTQEARDAEGKAERC
jgi:hypothetical protein